MKINLETLEDHQARVIAEFEVSSLDKFKVQAAHKIASRGKIPGFRPGKAPYDVIVRFYGESAIDDEAIEMMMNDVYPQMLTEAKLEPAAPGTLEKVERGDPLKFTFIVPLEPTVDLAGYKEIRKKYAPKPVTAKQVNDFLQRLRRAYATAEPVERPAETDDLVLLKLDATILNPDKDDKPELLKDSPLQLVIGDPDPLENEYPYPGFGNELIGLSANEEKTFQYTYPMDSKYENLRGKKVEFHVLLQNVKKMTLPEANDEFAKMFGDFENIEKFKENIKGELEVRQNAEYDQNYFQELIEEVTKQAVVKFPPQVLEHEMEHVIEAVTQDVADQHMDLDTYLKTINKDRHTWEEMDIKPIATRNLVQTLVIQEISKVEGIQLENEELNTETTNMLNEMQKTTDPKSLEKQLKNKDYLNNLAMNAAIRVMNRKVFERMRDIATGKAEKPVESEEPESKPKRKSKKSIKATEKPAEPVTEVLANDRSVEDQTSKDEPVSKEPESNLESRRKHEITRFQ